MGDTCLLFPDDAQWENWRYALAQAECRKLLARVNVYKVRHHGSLNATPKSLWAKLANRGGKRKPNRLLPVLSTKDHVHGSEVPREALVRNLRKDSTLINTRETAKSELRVTHRLALS